MKLECFDQIYWIQAKKNHS